MGLHETKKLLHSRENPQQNEKATFGMGENICKSSIKYIKNSHNSISKKKKNN